MQQQLVGLVRGGLAVIPGDTDLDIGRNKRSLQAVNLFQHRPDNRHGICSGPFGNGQGDGSLQVFRDCVLP